MTDARPWLEPTPVTVSDALRAAVGGHPLVAEVLARRGITDAARARAFLDPDAYTPAPAHALPDLATAAARLREAIAARERIWIWGDFDADGQTATALLYEGLRALGADVRYHIPHRREGHGLHLRTLERLLLEGMQLLITCDTGIAAHREIAFCRERGVGVIITDHHDLPEALPAADAALNPKRLPEGHPLRELSGAGVAFKLREALGDTSGGLELAAIGLIADVARLVDDVRYLVQRGLPALRRTARPGLQAMMEYGEVDPAGLDEEHVAFVIAPRLNALGRLDDATAAVALLTTDDVTQARAIASALEGLNSQRKMLVKQVLDAAEAQIARDYTVRGPGVVAESAIVVVGRHWPPGIIGIAAGRLAERYGRPAVLIAIGEDGSAAGSARSVPGCDIHAAIAGQRDLLRRYGGHPMAAGFALDEANVPAFTRRLMQAIAAAPPPRPPLVVDAYITPGDITPELAGELNRLAPFGEGNPPPCLVLRELTLVSHALIGRTQEHRRLIVANAAGETATVLQWHGSDLPLPEGPFDLACTLRASNWQGQPQPQLEWLDARELTPRVFHPPAPPVVVADHRQERHPEAVLREITRAGADVAVWAEGMAAPPAGARDRMALPHAAGLVVWTIPPGAEELQEALRAVAPQRVYLFAIASGEDAPADFLRHLAGRVKYALAHAAPSPVDGGSEEGVRVSIHALAAATAQRAATVRAGLRWLTAKGLITAQAEDDEWMVASGSGQATPELPQAEARLRELLQETAAYRAYYRQADAPEMIEKLMPR